MGENDLKYYLKLKGMYELSKGNLCEQIAVQ